MASTNLTLTAIAVKRVSGKAQTNINSTVNQELLPSTIQAVNSTIFGQAVPNSPDNTWSTHQFIVQSASLGGPGTAQLVEFALEPIAGTSYLNNPTSDTNPNDEGDSGTANTFHAYALKLSSSYEASAANNLTANASIGTTLGTAPFQDGYHLTGSRGALQIIPSYVSSITDNTNPYIPKLYSNNNNVEIVANDGIDWYLDTYAGILFVQDPQVTYPTQNSQQPGYVRAFIYTGKMQSDIVGTEHQFHILGNNVGYDVLTTQTASFVSGSAGLTVSASAGNQTITIGKNTDNVHFNRITGSDALITGSTIQFGNTGATVEFLGSASIAGDLIVQGTTTQIQTQNLLVEDKFILLNSGTLGSAPTDEGGIIVQTRADGSGSALFYDGNAQRWILTSASLDGINGGISSVTTNTLSSSNTMAAIVTVQYEAGNPSHTPFAGTGNYALGQMYIDSGSAGVTANNIWIYS